MNENTMAGTLERDLRAKLAELRESREGLEAELRQIDKGIEAIDYVLANILVDVSADPETPAKPPAPATPAYSPAKPPASVAPKTQRQVEEEEFRDVIVPPHGSATSRPAHQLMEDLAKLIPEVGQTVRVNEFIRNDSERATLKNKIDKHGGDRRFKWRRGIAGGARPARIERVAA